MVSSRFFWCVMWVFGISNSELFGVSLSWCVWYGLVMVIVGLGVVVSGVWLIVIGIAGV